VKARFVAIPPLSFLFFLFWKRRNLQDGNELEIERANGSSFLPSFFFFLFRFSNALWNFNQCLAVLGGTFHVNRRRSYRIEEFSNEISQDARLALRKRGKRRGAAISIYTQRPRARARVREYLRLDKWAARVKRERKERGRERETVSRAHIRMNHGVPIR